MKVIIIGISLLLIVSVVFVKGNDSGVPRYSPQVTAVLENLQQSRARELTDEERERCQLDSYANLIVMLMTARQDGDEVWHGRVEERWNELELYARQIENIYMFATWGPNYFWNDLSQPARPNYEERVSYLMTRISERLIEVYFESCNEHIRSELTLRYDPNTDRFQTSITTGVDAENNPVPCLCAADTRWYPMPMVMGYQVPHFAVNNQRVRPFLVATTYGTTASGVILVKHHIIPRILIVNFLKIWLGSVNEITATNPQNLFHSDCTSIIFGRIKLALQKLMAYFIVKTGRSQEGFRVNHDYRSMVFDDEFFEAIESLLTNSAGGNMFIGPANRGPLDPSYGTADNFYASLRAFESASEPIIGPQRYAEMRDLFRRLIRYCKNAHKLDTLTRMSRGVGLLVNILTIIERRDLTNYDESLWEERTLTQSELERVKGKKERRELRTQVFSAIKSQPKGPRKRRSVEDENMDNRIERKTEFFESGLEKCGPIDDYSKLRWTNFISDTIKSTLNNRQSGESSSWSCHLTRLYYHYRFQSYNAGFNNSDCDYSSFDRWLYKRISYTPEWRECIDNFGSSNKPEKWCQAWRRIMLNSDVGNYISNNTKPVQYYKDMDSVVQWLADFVINKDGSTRKVIKSGYPHELHYKRKELCYSLQKNGTAFGCSADCSGKEQAHGSLLGNNVVLYQSKWFENTFGKISCQCSKDPSLSVITPVATLEPSAPEDVSFLHGVLRFLTRTKCTDEDERHSERCSNLRR